jgi:hypothetical protein
MQSQVRRRGCWLRAEWVRWTGRANFCLWPQTQGQPREDQAKAEVRSLITRNSQNLPSAFDICDAGMASRCLAAEAATTWAETRRTARGTSLGLASSVAQEEAPARQPAGADFGAGLAAEVMPAGMVASAMVTSAARDDACGEWYCYRPQCQLKLPQRRNSCRALDAFVGLTVARRP